MSENYHEIPKANSRITAETAKRPNIPALPPKPFKKSDSKCEPDSERCLVFTHALLGATDVNEIVGMSQEEMNAFFAKVVELSEVSEKYF